MIQDVLLAIWRDWGTPPAVTWGRNRWHVPFTMMRALVYVGLLLILLRPPDAHYDWTKVTLVGASILAVVVLGLWGLGSRRSARRHLSRADRAEAWRSIAHGADPGDRRLAPLIIEQARYVHRSAEINSRRTRSSLVVALGMVAVAGGLTVNDTVHDDARTLALVIIWTLAILGVLNALQYGRRRAEVIAEAQTNAERAEAAARALLTADGRRPRPD